ncbi:MAG: integrase core domain-containing protein [Gemmatimonadales bacterium]
MKRWRHEYNTFRPHSVLGDRPPASAAAEPRTALRVGSKRVRRPGESHWGDNDTGSLAEESLREGDTLL